MKIKSNGTDTFLVTFTPTFDEEQSNEKLSEICIAYRQDAQFTEPEGFTFEKDINFMITNEGKEVPCDIDVTTMATTDGMSPDVSTTDGLTTDGLTTDGLTTDFNNGPMQEETTTVDLDGLADVVSDSTSSRSFNFGVPTFNLEFLVSFSLFQLYLRIKA